MLSISIKLFWGRDSSSIPTHFLLLHRERIYRLAHTQKCICQLSIQLGMATRLSSNQSFAMITFKNLLSFFFHSFSWNISAATYSSHPFICGGKECFRHRHHASYETSVCLPLKSTHTSQMLRSSSLSNTARVSNGQHCYSPHFSLQCSQALMSLRQEFSGTGAVSDT